MHNEGKKWYLARDHYLQVSWRGPSGRHAASTSRLRPIIIVVIVAAKLAAAHAALVVRIVIVNVIISSVGERERGGELL